MTRRELRMSDDKTEDEELVSTIGGVKIDSPRALGYYGAIGAAVAFEVISPQRGAFIAFVPLQLEWIDDTKDARAQGEIIELTKTSLPPADLETGRA